MLTPKKALQQYFLGLSNANVDVGLNSGGIGVPQANQSTREWATDSRARLYRRKISDRTDAYIQSMNNHITLVAEGKFDQLHEKIRADIINLRNFLVPPAPDAAEINGTAKLLKNQACLAIPQHERQYMSRNAEIPQDAEIKQWAEHLRHLISGQEEGNELRRNKILPLFALHQIQRHLEKPGDDDLKQAVPREFRSADFMVSGFCSTTFTLGDDNRPESKQHGTVFRLDADVMTQDGLRHVPLAFDSRTGKLHIDTNGLLFSRKRSAQEYGMRALFKSWASMVHQGQISYKPNGKNKPLQSPAFIPKFNGFQAKDTMVGWFLSGSANKALQKLRKATVSNNPRDAYLSEIKGLYQEANRLGYPIAWATNPRLTTDGSGHARPNPDYCKSYGLILQHIMPKEGRVQPKFGALKKHVQTLFIDNANGDNAQAEHDYTELYGLMQTNQQVQRDINTIANGATTNRRQQTQHLAEARQRQEGRVAARDHAVNAPQNVEKLKGTIQEVAGHQVVARPQP
jgi:hypothetical protein